VRTIARTAKIGRNLSITSILRLYLLGVNTNLNDILKMFMKLVIFLSGFLFVALIVTAFLFLPAAMSEPLISPVFNVNKLRFSDNVWFPNTHSLGIPQAKAGPLLTAKAVFAVDASSGQILFDQGSHIHLPIASLTKIMTVVVAVESQPMDKQFIISQQAVDMEPDKMFLKAGERLSLKELLDGIFLVSANDAAEQLAESTTGRREEFINIMNSKAAQLGMKDTHFINPTGLEEDPPQNSGVNGQLQYSTAYDVALMTRYAIKNYPHLLGISSQPQIIIPETKNHQSYELNNGINLVTTYPGVVGFKTGYTPEAGLTLVTVVKRKNQTIISVLLGSENRRDDAKKLLDFITGQLGI